MIRLDSIETNRANSRISANERVGIQRAIQFFKATYEITTIDSSNKLRSTNSAG